MKLANIFSNKKKSQERSVVVGFGKDGIAVAYTEKDAEGQPTIKLCDFLACTSEKYEKVLADWVKQHDLLGQPCRWILESSEYHLLQIEKLNVPDSELCDAVRWRVQDLVEYGVSDLLVDVFQIPAPQGYSSAKKMFVVACSKNALQAGCARIEDAGLVVNHIGIYELALCDLVHKAIDKKDCGALLMPGMNQSVLMMTKQEELCLTRELNTDISSHTDVSDLVQELTRTFDYFDYDLGQGMQPKQIIIAPHADVTHEYAKRLAQALKKRVSILNLAALSESLKGFSMDMQQRCLGVVAGSIGGHGTER